VGLNAYVRCTCYRDGHTAPPPVSAELVVVDETGEPDLTLPYQGHEETHSRFWQWLRSCCPHRHMYFEWVHVSNWQGVISFQRALERAGSERFPTLLTEAPSRNGGVMSTEAAARAPEELAMFGALPHVGHTWYLVNGDTGEVLYEYLDGDDGIFFRGGRSGVDLGLDPRGFFVASRSDPPRELFRAMRLEQRPVDPRGFDPYRHPAVEFVDGEGAQRFTSPAAVTVIVPWPDGRAEDGHGRVNQHAPRRLRVERRRVTPDDYRYQVEALERVCRAALATGNPVAWACGRVASGPHPAFRDTSGLQTRGGADRAEPPVPLDPDGRDRPGQSALFHPLGQSAVGVRAVVEDRALVVADRVPGGDGERRPVEFGDGQRLAGGQRLDDDPPVGLADPAVQRTIGEAIGPGEQAKELLDQRVAAVPGDRRVGDDLLDDLVVAAEQPHDVRDGRDRAPRLVLRDGGGRLPGAGGGGGGGLLGAARRGRRIGTGPVAAA
jgi:hypothetical protein